MSLEQHLAGRAPLSRHVHRQPDNREIDPRTGRGTIMRIDAPGLAMAETVACPPPDMPDRKSIQCQALTHTLLAALRWALPDVGPVEASFCRTARECAVTFIPTPAWREATLSRIHRYGRSIVAMNCDVYTGPLTAGPLVPRPPAVDTSATIPVSEWMMRSDFAAVGRSVGTTALIGAFSLRLQGVPAGGHRVRLVARTEKTALYWYCG